MRRRDAIITHVTGATKVLSPPEQEEVVRGDVS
jgi:hypothetical protein